MTKLNIDGNYLFYGDNLDVLRRYVPNDCVNLVYLDPPFKSNQDYNVLFAEKNGAQSAAQILAFGDTWRWDQSAVKAYEEVMSHGGKIAEAVKALRSFLGTSDMMAYLAMMAPRLSELKRVMKSTASIYMHCDSTASHYLKMLMDAVFGVENFVNEIIWKRTSAHSDARRYGRNADVILFYTKSSSYTWNVQYTDYDEKYVDQFYRHVDPETGRRYRLSDLTAAGTTKGTSGKPWKGVDPTDTGRHWAVPTEIIEKHKVRAKTSQGKLDALDRLGLIYWPPKGKTPAYIRYLDEMPGAVLQTIWTDIPPIGAHAKERLGYPTQKPITLLERMIRSSSNEGDIVLDPFCGCGTTIAAAQKIGRRWLGIDITHLAISLIKHRLVSSYGNEIKYEIIGEPVDESGAKALADADKYQFRYWALGLVGARPAEQKKGSDKGIDGKIFFHDEVSGGKTKTAVISVKGGHVQVSHIRDMRGVIERDEAEIGVLITLNPPTREMKTEAADAGFYESRNISKSKHSRIQILTIDELINGKRLDLPITGAGNGTLKTAPKVNSGKVRGKESEQMDL